jgi:hypothetical protein
MLNKLKEQEYSVTNVFSAMQEAEVRHLQEARGAEEAVSSEGVDVWKLNSAAQCMHSVCKSSHICCLSSGRIVRALRILTICHANNEIVTCFY